MTADEMRAGGLLLARMGASFIEAADAEDRDDREGRLRATVDAIRLFRAGIALFTQINNKDPEAEIFCTGGCSVHCNSKTDPSAS